MKLVAPKGAIWRIWARAFNPMVYSPSISFLLSVSNSFSSMSSSSTSGVSSEWTSVPSKALEIPQVLKDLMTISLGISAYTSLIHQRTRFLLGAFFFQAGVYSNGPNVIHAKYFRCTLSLNGLFRHLSKGCTKSCPLVDQGRKSLPILPWSTRGQDFCLVPSSSKQGYTQMAPMSSMPSTFGAHYL